MKDRAGRRAAVSWSSNAPKQPEAPPFIACRSTAANSAQWSCPRADPTPTGQGRWTKPMRRALLLLLAIVLAVPAAAQRRLPVIIPLGRSQPAPPQLTGIDALRADFLARSGADT